VNPARRLNWLRSAYYLLLEIRRTLPDTPGRSRAALERRYSGARDPWNYESDSGERERYALALELIDAHRAGSRPRALEVGCGEGAFTAELAARCESVLALDVSAVALQRARDRCVGLSNVSFAEWDARADPSPGSFELVVCMDAVDEILRPLARRRAIAKVSASVAGGGQLLVTSFVQDPIVEQAAWARWLGRGGAWTVQRFGTSDERLTRVETRELSRHLLALYRATG
jgi:SAM-dependent methyltransferase